MNLKLIHNEKVTRCLTAQAFPLDLIIISRLICCVQQMQEHSTLEGELAALREQKSLLDDKLKAADEEVKGLGAKRSEDQSR